MHGEWIYAHRCKWHIIQLCSWFRHLFSWVAMELTWYHETASALLNTRKRFVAFHLASSKLTHDRDTLGVNQTCTLFGSEGGNRLTSGTSYLSAGYGIDVKDLRRRNLLVLIGFFFLFQLTQIFILEFFPVCSFVCQFLITLNTVTSAIRVRSLGQHLCKRNERDAGA